MRTRTVIALLLLWCSIVFAAPALASEQAGSGAVSVSVDDSALTPEERLSVITHGASPLFDGPHAGLSDSESPVEVLEIGCPARAKRLRPALGRNAAGRIIVIDPGHGGWDNGAVNARMGLREKDINLAVSLMLADELKRRGYRVVLTRTTDCDVKSKTADARSELNARVKLAKRSKAALFISLHCNAAPSRAARGTSLHWCKSGDYGLALTMQSGVQAHLPTKQRGLVFNRFYVLRNNAVPAVLMEMAFISNDGDARILASGEFRRKVTLVVADGLEHYLAARDKAGSELGQR